MNKAIFTNERQELTEMLIDFLVASEFIFQF